MGRRTKEGNIHARRRCYVHRRPPRKAVAGDFFLPGNIPLPPDVAKSTGIVPESDPKVIRAWWELHLDRVNDVVNDASGLQGSWNMSAPDAIRSETGTLHTVALAFLRQTSDLRGENGLNSPPTFSLSSGAYLRKEFTLATLPVRRRPPNTRHLGGVGITFYLPGRPSGYLHAKTLRNGALGQAKLGWLGDPFPINLDDAVAIA